MSSLMYPKEEITRVENEASLFFQLTVVPLESVPNNVSLLALLVFTNAGDCSSRFVIFPQVTPIDKPRELWFDHAIVQLSSF